MIIARALQPAPRVQQHPVHTFPLRMQHGGAVVRPAWRSIPSIFLYHTRPGHMR
jgi:hypothetical protein